MRNKYKNGFGGNYTIRWLIKMYGINRAIIIYCKQEYVKLQTFFTHKKNNTSEN